MIMTIIILPREEADRNWIGHCHKKKTKLDWTYFPNSKGEISNYSQSGSSACKCKY